MTGWSPTDRKEYANIAAVRAKFYGIAVFVAFTLPDEDYLKSIRGSTFLRFLENWRSLDDELITAGISEIKTYLRDTTWKPAEIVIKNLAVDRTRLLRGYGDDRLNLPYEGLYAAAADKSGNFSTMLKVKAFYRDAGLLPEDDCRETPDHLGIELDFMRMLCLREETQWKANDDLATTLSLEERFIREHLGAWLGNYCSLAVKSARTGFYKGFFKFLNGMINLESQYLEELLSNQPDSYGTCLRQSTNSSQ